MSDELRSAPGHRPDQRRNRGAPAWWSQLDRSDLPDHDSTSSADQPLPGAPVPRTRGAAGRPRLSGRPRSAVITVAVVLVAVAIACIAVGAASARSVVVVVLGFGVPALLALATAGIILRRAG